MTTLPSFVDLLSSLGLDEKDDVVQPARKQHLRTDSWGSAHSSASSRPSPLHSPHIRLSGRQPSSGVPPSRRFAPYQARDLNDRRGSLPSLSAMPPLPVASHIRTQTSSFAAQRRRSGSLPTLLESPFGFPAQNTPYDDSISETSESSRGTSTIASPTSATPNSPIAYTFPPTLPRDSIEQRYRSSLITTKAGSSPTRSARSALPPLAPLSPREHGEQREPNSTATSPELTSASSTSTSSTDVNGNKQSFLSSISRSPLDDQHPDPTKLSKVLPRMLSLPGQQDSQPISSFVLRRRPSASPTSPLPPYDSQHSNRPRHHHPYQKHNTMPRGGVIDADATRCDNMNDWAVLPGSTPATTDAPGQRWKRRGSLTLSLAPLSISSHSLASRGGRSPRDGGRADQALRSPITPRTPLSPMVIPTLPDAVGIVQRNMSGFTVPTLPSVPGIPSLLPAMPTGPGFIGKTKGALRKKKPRLSPINSSVAIAKGKLSAPTPAGAAAISSISTAFVVEHKGFSVEHRALNSRSGVSLRSYPSLPVLPPFAVKSPRRAPQSLSRRPSQPQISTVQHHTGTFQARMNSHDQAWNRPASTLIAPPRTVVVKTEDVDVSLEEVDQLADDGMEDIRRPDSSRIASTSRTRLAHSSRTSPPVVSKHSRSYSGGAQRSESFRPLSHGRVSHSRSSSSSAITADNSISWTAGRPSPPSVVVHGVA